ncbi:MAG TPA: segregation/condensation protein A [Elusimicrobiota bacterium]|nr:segregation/condensation protein A [Elusimicrobiota bacterium]
MTEPSAAVTPATVPSGIDVRLENFEGPLDLLLYLIRRDDLDIYDIPIASITQEYLAYLDLMKDLNLEAAGEFLVMASMLIQIKAQMLLPTPQGEQEEGPDPRAELVSKLLEYQQFKQASEMLSNFKDKAKDIYYRSAPPHFGEEEYVLKASVIDLLAAFKRILEEAPREVGQILREEIPIEVKIREILDRLVSESSVAFEDLFGKPRRRLEMIVTFMALLELIRLKQIVALQADNFSPIRIYRADAAPQESARAAEPEPSSVLPEATIAAIEVAPATEPLQGRASGSSDTDVSETEE